MAKFAKVCLIGAAIMIALGLFIGGIASVIGGRNFIRVVSEQNIGWNFNPFDWNFNWWGSRWNNRWNNKWNDKWNDSRNDNYDLTVNGKRIADKNYAGDYLAADGIDKLSISAGAGVFEVIPWQEENFYIEIDGVGKCQYYSQGKTLYVGGFDTSGFNTLNFNADKNRMTLYVPQNISYNDIKIDAGVGTLNIGGLTADNLESDTGVGSLVMRDMTLGRLEINAGVGEVTFAGEVNGDIGVECGIGNISLRVRGEKEDFDYEINCAMGNITVERESYGAFAGSRTVNNDAGQKMWLACSLGNIDVSFY